MSRYNTNAGLKGAAPPELPTGDNEKAPLPRWVLPLIVIGASLVVITLLVLSVAVCAVSQQEGATSDEPTTTQSETTALDYNELFAEEETTSEHENVFIKKDTSNSQAPSPQRQTQPSTKATTQPPRNNQSSASNNSTSNSSNNSSGGSNSGGSSGGNSGGGNSGGSPGGNSGGGNSGGSSGGNSGGGNSGGGNSGGSGSSSSSGGGGGSSSKQSVNPPQPAQPAQPAKPSTIAVTGVSISNSSLTLYIGETANLSASVSPSNATNKSITWASGNSSVASVSQGTVKANKEGTTTIYAASNNGKKAGCSVTVKKKPEEPKARLIPSEVNMYVGEQYVISLMGATDAEWESSNPFVVKLIPGIHNCYVTGEKAGVTNIIATLPNGEKIKCKVTVKA